jgi:excisionase family DNA binding protein
MPRQLSVADAARVLRVSRRTIERRVKAGTLATTFVTGQKRVILPDEVLDATDRDMPPERHDTDGDATAATMTELVALRAQLEAITSDRDFLRETVNRLLETNAQLTARLLPGPSMGPQDPGPVAPVDEPPRRRRWPWQR